MYSFIRSFSQLFIHLIELCVMKCEVSVDEGVSKKKIAQQSVRGKSKCESQEFRVVGKWFKPKAKYKVLNDK